MESDRPPVLDTRPGITLKIATELSGALLEKPKIVIICGPLVAFLGYCEAISSGLTSAADLGSGSLS